jgi:hypothetical protein
MNEEQLGKIENRWLAAGGGPWVISDNTHEPGILFVSTTAAKGLEKGDASLLKENSFVLATYGEAEKRGAVSSKDEWISFLEEQVCDPDGLVYGRYKCITPTTHAKLEAEERLYDKRFARQVDGPEPTHPAFAILPDCRQEDLEFVVHAPRDIGDLIGAVRKADAIIASLKEDLSSKLNELEAMKIAEQETRIRMARLRQIAQEIMRPSE